MLHALLRRYDASLDLANVPDAKVARVRDDSRLVRPGDLFVARSGLKTDGRQFLEDAATRGAVAAVVDKPIANPPLPVVQVEDAAAAASCLAHLALGSPTDFVQVVGVTGTNGKTTTTYLLRHLLKKAGKRCGMVGTVEIDDGSILRESEMTTPGAVQLAEIFADMRENNCIAAAVETSSHALHQGRCAGVRFAGGGFTNLTGDHLDYHGDMDAYAAAKAKLFATMDATAVAAVNADDPWSERIARYGDARKVTFGQKRDADYRATDVSVTAAGTKFILVTPDGRAEVNSPLIGRHNVENALCAATLAGEVFGLTVHQIAAGLRDATGAPGRLEPVKAGQDFAVLVDYAHTDDALKNVLTALRPLCKGKLRVVFGCGGDRDRTKRPRMANIACELGDVVYATSDNPRTEDPQAILDEVQTGANAGAEWHSIVDRREAIGRAIGEASNGDIVLIAGKGHENYQIVGTTKFDFDDVKEATAAIHAQHAIESPR